MAKVTISIQCDNAAFDDPTGPNQEISCILKGLANDIRQGSDYKALLDANGQKVGEYQLRV